MTGVGECTNRSTPMRMMVARVENGMASAPNRITGPSMIQTPSATCLSAFSGG